jgi:hypothetical protein
VTVNRTTVAGAMRIETGNSIDRIELQSSTFMGDASIRTRGQDDSVRVRGTVFEGQSPINAGIGTNEIDREVILEWDFSDGAQGWEALFADYGVFVPPNSGEGAAAEALAAFQFRSGIEALPAPLDKTRTGFVLSGNNISDDLFMFLHRGIGAAEGLMPETEYVLTFDVGFASNAPAGLGGVGGPPAEAVDMLVGAAPRVPEVGNFRPGDPMLRSNIRRLGNRGEIPGSEMSVAGDIRNGGPPDTNSDYRIVGLTHTHPWALTPDAQGRLWVVVGTDSGFESTTTLFYTSVRVRLTPQT